MNEISTLKILEIAILFIVILRDLLFTEHCSIKVPSNTVGSTELPSNP